MTRQMNTPHKGNMHSIKLFARLDIWQDYEIYGLVECSIKSISDAKCKKLSFQLNPSDKIYYSSNVNACCKQIIVR